MEILREQPSRIEYNISGKGIVKCQYILMAEPIQISKFFLCEEAVREVKISREEKDKLQDILDKATKVDGSFDNEVISSILSLLGDDRCARLRQVQLALLFQWVGFHSALEQPKLVKYLGIDSNDAKRRPELFDVQMEIVKTLREDDKSLSSDCFEELVGKLDDQQREGFSNEWGKVFQRPGGTYQLIHQFQFDRKRFRDAMAGDLLEEWPPSVFLDFLPSHEELKYFVESPEFPRMQRLAVCSYLFKLPAFSKNMDIMEVQVVEVDSILNDWRQLSITIGNDIGARAGLESRKIPIYTIESGDTPVDYETTYDLSKSPESLKELQQALESRAAEFEGKLMKVLTRPQKDYFLAGVKEIRLAYHGPLACLLEGELGVTLELTEAQKSSILRASEKLIDQAQSESQAKIEAAFAKLVKSIPPDEQNAIEDALGPAMDSRIVDLYAFSILLESIRQPK
jgi:hypothetical protein